MKTTADRILDTAYDIAVEEGFHNLIRETVATRANVAAGSVNHHFVNMQCLRDAVMTRAVELGELHIVAAGLANRDPIAIAAPDDLKRKALDTLM